MSSRARLRVLQTKRDDHAKEFNTLVYGLIRIASTQHPRDVNLLRIKDLIKVALSASDGAIIVEAGPYLIKYKHMIREQNFLENFNEETLQAEISSTKDGAKAKDTALGLFQMIGALTGEMKPVEIKDIYRRINDMLKAYLSFVIIDKEIKAF